MPACRLSEYPRPCWSRGILGLAWLTALTACWLPLSASAANSAPTINAQTFTIPETRRQAQQLGRSWPATLTWVMS